MMYMRLIVVLILLLFAVVAHGQRKRQRADTTGTVVIDSLKANENTRVVPIETYASRFDPRKALLYSAVLPGAGQAYNKKYWKVPLVYGALGVGYFMADRYNTQYKLDRSRLFSLLNDDRTEDPDNPGFTLAGNRIRSGSLLTPQGLTLEQIRNRVNRFQRDRDFSLMLMGVIYFAQLVEAHVDAHLKEFQLNPALRASIEPCIKPIDLGGRSKGLSLVIRF